MKYTITALKDIYVRAYMSCNGPDQPPVEVDFPLRRKQSQQGVTSITSFGNSRKSLKPSAIVCPTEVGGTLISGDFARIEATED